MAGPPLVIHVVGLKNTGKSGLVESLVRELARLGVKTGVLKHDGAGHFHWDREGTDTYRMRSAGSLVTAILSDRDLAVHGVGGLEITLPEIAETFFRGVDLLLVEGFKNLEGKKVEVLREGVSTRPLSREGELLATFGDRVFERDAPHFEKDRVQALAELLFQRLRATTTGAVR